MTAHDEFLSLVRTAGYAVHDGDVHGGPSYPYVLVSRRKPSFDGRALSRSPLGRRLRWVLTPAGQSSAAVQDIVLRLIGAIEGARLMGQRIEYHPTGIDIEKEEDLVVNNLPIFFSKLEFGVTLPQ